MPGLVQTLLNARRDDDCHELPWELFTPGIGPVAFAELANYLGLLNEQERAAYTLLARAKARLIAERQVRGRLLEDYL